MLEEFIGAKLLLFIGAQLVVIRRDDIATIPWPGYLDFPGGGREVGETPEQTILREVHEELGLTLDPQQLVWRQRFERTPETAGFWFAAHLPLGTERDIVFGGEGQGWELMRTGKYLFPADAIPHFKSRLSAYLDQIADTAS